MNFQILHDLFSSIWEVLLNLIICKFEYLESIRECCLCSFSLGKVVDDLLVWVGLLDIIIIEVDNGVSVGEDFPFDAIIKNYLLLSVFINSLNLTIMTYNLLHNFHVLRILVMINLREFHVKIFLFIFICIYWW